MKKVFYNSKFINDTDLKITSSNRAFNYGDGFFESIKIINSKPFNFKNHFKRMELASNILSLKNNYTELFLLDIIKKLIQLNNVIDGKLKIHISRSEIKKKISNSNLLISVNHGDKFKFNVTASLCFYEKETKSVGNLSSIKSSNYLISILSSIYAKQQNFNNSILFNNLGNIIESSNSNIFIVRNGVIYTPPISDGCVAGTMRFWVIDNFHVIEKSLSRIDLFKSDEMFTTNAISGITSVKEVEGFSFSDTQVAMKIQSLLISLGSDS